MEPVPIFKEHAGGTLCLLDIEEAFDNNNFASQNYGFTREGQRFGRWSDDDAFLRMSLSIKM